MHSPQRSPDRSPISASPTARDRRRGPASPRQDPWARRSRACVQRGDPAVDDTCSAGKVRFIADQADSPAAGSRGFPSGDSPCSQALRAWIDDAWCIPIAADSSREIAQDVVITWSSTPIRHFTVTRHPRPASPRGSRPPDRAPHQAPPRNSLTCTRSDGQPTLRLISHSRTPCADPRSLRQQRRLRAAQLQRHGLFRGVKPKSRAVTVHGWPAPSPSRYKAARAKSGAGGTYRQWRSVQSIIGRDGQFM
jgi:hypothetical protein